MLREGLQRLAGWGWKAMGGWRRPEKLVIDIDSLPGRVRNGLQHSLDEESGDPHPHWAADQPGSAVFAEPPRRL